MTTFVVGIGCDEAQHLAAEVLEYSVKLHAQAVPRILKLHEEPGWATMSTELKGRQRTPFSFQRFLLARRVLDSSADVGIYLDSDMLMLQPVERLVQAFCATGCEIATVEPLPQWRRQHQSSVMLFSRAGAQRLCARYEQYLTKQSTYDDLIRLRGAGTIGTIDYCWNCLEYLDERTALVHYTDMDTQPWLRDGNPNAGIWYTYLWRYAQQTRGPEIIRTEIQRRHVRPALEEVIRLGPSLSAFSPHARLKDAFFVPPHRFKRIRLNALRLAIAPLLNLLIGLQFVLTNGQPNTR